MIRSPLTTIFALVLALVVGTVPADAGQKRSSRSKPAAKSAKKTVRKASTKKSTKTASRRPARKTAAKPPVKSSLLAQAKKDPTILPRAQASALVAAQKLPPFYYPKDLSQPPVIAAPYAILIDAETGQALWSKNADVRRPMASTTKIMTALLFIEHTQPTDMVTCLDPSIKNIEPSSLNIQPWEKFTAQDLLYGFLLRSGNDGAVLIAEHVAGSVANFAQMMNERARQIGAIHTNFVNPHGLHNPNHYSTARDLAMIAREAMKNPRFEDAVSQPRRVIQRSKNLSDRVITAKVKPYFYDKFAGADGIKTGYTRAAGHCFVGSATRNGRRLISVVLDAPNSASMDTKPILSWGFARFVPQFAAKKDSPAGEVPVTGGVKSSVSAVAGADLRVITDTLGVILPTEPRIEIQGTNITAPITKGQVVGALTAYIGKQEVGMVDLVAAEDVAAAPVAAAITRGKPWILPAVGGILAILIGCIYATTSAKGNRRRRNSFASSR